MLFRVCNPEHEAELLAASRVSILHECGHVQTGRHAGREKCGVGLGALLTTSASLADTALALAALALALGSGLLAPLNNSRGVLKLQLQKNIV